MIVVWRVDGSAFVTTPRQHSQPGRTRSQSGATLPSVSSGFVRVQQQRSSMGFSSSWRSARSQTLTSIDGSVVSEGVQAIME
jgi:hypothetical protein